jgi:hypothetical protein
MTKYALVFAISTSLAVGLCNAVGAGFLDSVPRDLTPAIRKITQSLQPQTGLSPLPATRKAVYEYDLASVLVGLSRGPVGYKFVLLATVPASIDPSEEANIRRSIPTIVRGVTATLQSKIDQLPQLDFSQVGSKPEDVLKSISSYSDNIKKAMNEAFSAASQDFNIQFKGLFPKYANDSSLAVALRPCAGSACSLKQLASNAAKYRFGRFYDWANFRGFKTVNQAYLLNQQGSFVPVVATLDKGHEWHVDFPKSDLQLAFVNAVKRARDSKETLSYTTAELAGLSKEIAAHLANVFDFPYSAGTRLASNPNGMLETLVLGPLSESLALAKLMGLSDELGRTRLRDCVRLRGSFDPEEAGKCAGYKVNQHDLVNCLVGGDCMPPFGGEVNMETLLTKPYATLADIAGSTMLPRIQLGKADDLVNIANKCRDAGPNDSGYCLLKETVGRDKKGAQILDCIHAAGGRAAALANCATAGLPDDQRQKLECFQANSKDAKALALCANRDALPPAAQKMIACASNLKRTASSVAQTASCLGVANASPEAACLLKHRDSWADAALCISGDKTPTQVKDAVHCAQTSNNLTGFGVCMVANEASGEAQRIAACYAEAQGVPAAVAVCLASKNLTQDQRIVLQCAAQTNGAPHATAICAGGKMAAKEMMNCKGKKFGEGNCFNENNELRKLSKTLGLEIGPKSFVADVINIQLQITQLTSGPILDSANKALPEVMKIVGPAMVPDPKHPGKFILRNILGPVGGAAVEDFCRHNPCPKIEIKVGNPKPIHVGPTCVPWC